MCKLSIFQSIKFGQKSVRLSLKETTCLFWEISQKIVGEGRLLQLRSLSLLKSTQYSDITLKIKSLSINSQLIPQIFTSLLDRWFSAASHISQNFWMSFHIRWSELSFRLKEDHFTRGIGSFQITHLKNIRIRVVVRTHTHRPPY